MANEQEVVVEKKEGEVVVEVKSKVGEEIKAKALTPEEEEIKKKEEHKLNLDKAIAQGTEDLRVIREAKKKETGKTVEGEIPVIDDNDPGAKAWNGRIKETVAPALAHIEKQKEEVRTFALRKFLSDKPSLAKTPEKLKELLSNYDRIKTSSEQTQEGVLMDLEKAYGATFHEELISAARSGRIDQAKNEMIFSDIAVDKGATSETTKAPVKKQLSAEEQAIVSQWEQYGAPKVD